jgi:polyhydroxybutyrate depolymerase
MILFRNWCLLALAVAAIVPISASAADTVDHYAGRDMIVHVPARLPVSGSRALVVVLHGGMGNADRIANSQSESGLNLDAEADRDGFIVVYLNGTAATRFAGARALGWNAGGGCCGQPARNGTDDVAYISGAAGYLAGKYGIDRKRVFGIGQTNGAKMTPRILCETSRYAAGVAISGPLNLPVARCPGARAKRILAIHGADDQNVPIAGGRGTKGLAQVAWSSEARARQVMTGSGATYDLQVVPGADHMLDHLSAAIAKSEGVTIARKAAAFFGLTGKKG